MKQRILMLNYEFPPLGGGSANANFYLLKELSEHPELEVELITSSVDEFKIVDFASNIKIHYLDIGKNGNLHFQSITDLLKYSWKAFQYAKKLIKTGDFNLIHCFFGIPSGYLAMNLGLPYIVSLRGSDVPFHTPKYKTLDTLLFGRLSKRIWKRSAFTVTNSKGLTEEALVTSPSQPFEVIYNGVDTQKFGAKTYDSTDSLKVITTGRLASHKGCMQLLQAMQGLKNAELTFIGDGPQREELESYAKVNNITCHFTGKLPQEEMIPRLQASDVFVLPSLNEGMSNSMLEAMACGLPIVATNVGGSLELIKTNGFVVEKGTPAPLLEALKKYEADNNLLEVHGQESRKLANTLNWKSMAEAYHELYKKTSDVRN